MRLNDLGEVIATRKFWFLGESDREIIAKIGKPRPSEHDDFFCPVQITGIGDEQVHAIFGVDSVQAIELSLKFLGSELRRLNAESQGRIRWGNDPQDSFGFPEF